MKTFGAPWGKPLIWISALVTVLCLALSFGLPMDMKGGTSLWIKVLAMLPALLPLACLLFVVRGYEIHPDAILVRRLLWKTRIERGGLTSAVVDPNAMKKSIRTFGNGGFYSFTGRFWNKRLGSYRAFVTDWKHCVVLKFRHRTVVVSPDDPSAFVEALELG